MGEWPDNWFRDGQEPADGDAGGGSDANGDKTVSIPSNQHPGGQYQVRQYPGSGQGAGGQGAGGQGAGGQGAGGQGAAGPRPAPPPGGWPQQPPVSR